MYFKEMKKMYISSGVCYPGSLGVDGDSVTVCLRREGGQKSGIVCRQASERERDKLKYKFSALGVTDYSFVYD